MQAARNRFFKSDSGRHKRLRFKGVVWRPCFVIVRNHLFVRAGAVQWVQTGRASPTLHISFIHRIFFMLAIMRFPVLHSDHFGAGQY